MVRVNPDSGRKCLYVNSDFTRQIIGIDRHEAVGMLRFLLECGILAHGFLRLHCGDCGHDKLVAFSCKGCGFCPSCGARRMAQAAARSR